MSAEHDSQARQDAGKHDKSRSIEEAARLLGCSARTIRRRIKAGSLKAFERPIPRGFEWRILLEDEPVEETEGRQAAVIHDKEASQPAEEARQEPVHDRQEPVKHDTGVEEPAEPLKEPAGQPEEAPAPSEPGLLKALDMLNKSQDEIKRLQEENKELASRAAYFQAKLQDAQERILMLEAQPAEEEQKAEPAKPSRSWWRKLIRRS